MPNTRAHHVHILWIFVEYHPSCTLMSLPISRQMTAFHIIWEAIHVLIRCHLQKFPNHEMLSARKSHGVVYCHCGNIDIVLFRQCERVLIISWSYRTRLGIVVYVLLLFFVLLLEPPSEKHVGYFVISHLIPFFTIFSSCILHLQ